MKERKNVTSVSKLKKSNRLIVGEMLEKAKAAIKTAIPDMPKKIGADILFVKRSKIRKLNIKTNSTIKT
ncbi:hypothetical protein PESHB4_19150 [Pediococcus ethanolidurans]|nr:hypothetical protein PET01_04330 [Pediococcus ethanolidurans]